MPSVKKPLGFHHTGYGALNVKGKGYVNDSITAGSRVAQL